MNNCVHCHICQNNCEFLKKYNMDIGDIENHPEFLYHCLLCGKCSEVCPLKIDGRQEILNLRRKQVEENQGRVPEKGYEMLLLEKQDYLFRNHRKGKKKSVLFPGCNFPSFYPKTTKKLVDLFAEQGIGVIYDCCGKPVGELGMQQEEDRIIADLNRRLEAAGVEEVITACPNCWNYLSEKITVPIRNIYDKLQELGMGNKIYGGGEIFLPCPDRKAKAWYEDIQAFLKEEPRIIAEAQCCGLGGGAAVKEPQLSKRLAERIGQDRENVYVYCASCACNLARTGCSNVYHYLPEILGTHEQPDTKKSLLNRAKLKLLY